MQHLKKKKKKKKPVKFKVFIFPIKFICLKISQSQYITICNGIFFLLLLINWVIFQIFKNNIKIIFYCKNPFLLK